MTSKDDIQVRAAAGADIPALEDLIARSARALSRGFYSDAETESAIRHVFGVDSTLVADGTYFVAEIGGALAGCGGWSRRRNLYGGDQRPVGSQDLLDPARDAARIRAFFVAPDAARRGVGRRLYEACAAAATASGFRSLELMATLPGVLFYRAVGFREIEPVADTLPDGTVLRFVRMKRELDTAVDPGVERTIQLRLDEIERSEDVKILYACESGSRAWGFASRDSDYDVRFLYIHRPEWYLSIEDGRDVIERPIDDALDISGWDLRKALGLLRRSNPPLLEWLGSPLVYRERDAFASRLRAYAARFHSPRSCAHHYLHMAQGNFREYLRGPEVWRKKYLYVLRPLLAIRWIRREMGVVPTEFGVLIARVLDDPPLVASIHDLLREKRDGLELDRGPRIEPISAFIEAELAALESFEAPPSSDQPPVEELDRLFRDTLRAAWLPGPAQER